MILMLIVILILIMLIATLFESVFGLEHRVAGYTAMAFVATVIVAILAFYLFTAKGRAIVRTWNIQEIRKKRIEREFHESWRHVHKKSISKEDRKLIREIDQMTKSSDTDDKSSIVGYYGWNCGDGDGWNCGDGGGGDCGDGGDGGVF